MSTKNLYDKKIYSIGGARKNAILSFIKKNNSLVLDVGCGDGSLGEILKKEKNCTVYGIDISSSSLNVAKKRIDKVYLLDLEKENLPVELKEKKFDYIIITEVLEHLLFPEVMLKRIKKIADSNTEIIVTVPNILFWKNRLKIFFGKFDYEDEGLMDRGHIHFFSWRSFCNLLNKGGFKILQIKNNIPTRGTKFLGKIFPGLFAYQFIVKARKRDKVVYTAIFGGKDELRDPKFINDDFDYICFTDSDIKSKVWKIVKCDPVDRDPVRSAKIYKILPHKYLTDYKISIWVDGNAEIKGDLDLFVNKNLNKNNIAVYDHSCLDDGRNCIYKEAEELISMAKRGKYKDDPKLIKKQIDKYRKLGYPENNGLLSGMIILRRHNEKDVIKTMDDWWNEIKNNSRRDQLSFNYVAWKNNLNFKFIKEKSVDNKFFKRFAHKKRYTSF